MGKCLDYLVGGDVHANYPVGCRAQSYDEPCVAFLEECKCANEIVTLNGQSFA